MSYAQKRIFVIMNHLKLLIIGLLFYGQYLVHTAGKFNNVFFYIRQFLIGNSIQLSLLILLYKQVNTFEFRRIQLFSSLKHNFKITTIFESIFRTAKLPLTTYLLPTAYLARFLSKSTFSLNQKNAFFS